VNLPIKALLFGLALSLMHTVQAVEIAGAKIDETAQVANAALKLNGAGIRYKVFFKVYVAALYLTENKSTTESILALNGPKKITLTMLREISSDTLAQAFMDGVKKNTEIAERTRLADQFIKFGQLFSTVAEINKGDVISIESVPNVGCYVLINGKRIGDTFTDPGFFNALLRIWIGENPVDGPLKIKLLGGVTQSR
jgi:hypothetical protein